MPHTVRRNKVQSFASVKSGKVAHVETQDGWSTVVRQGQQLLARQQHHETNVGISQDGTRDIASPRALNEQFSTLNVNELYENLTPAQFQLYQSLSRAGKNKVLNEDVLKAQPKSQPARYTVEELRQRYNKIRAIWQKSSARSLVKALLGRVVESCLDDGAEGRTGDAINEEILSRPKIQMFVCLGLGSPSADMSGWRGVVIWQLVVFIDVAQIISNGPPAGLYAQDPIFNTTDTSFLQSLSVEVMQSPSGFELIDQKTLVYAPHYPVACWPTQMREGTAACIIGNDVEGARTRLPSREDVIKLFRQALPATPPHPHGTEHISLSKTFPNQSTTATATTSNPASHTANIPVPDLDAIPQLLHFLATHESSPWPEPEEAEHVLNDMFIYWPQSANGEEEMTR